jgi:hypothetical protein
LPLSNITMCFFNMSVSESLQFTSVQHNLESELKFIALNEKIEINRFKIVCKGMQIGEPHNVSIYGICAVL